MRKSISSSKLEYYQKEIKALKVGFDDLKDHVVITDGEGIILYVNKAAEKKTGFSKEEILGRTPADLWGGNMPKEFYEKMWHQIKEKKQPFVGEMQNKRKDGTEQWQELHISPILDEEGNVKFFIGIEPVITDRKMRERFREEFISIVGHQFRNPLTAIRWTLDQLLRNNSLSKKQYERLREVYKHNKNLSDLVDDLLIISRTEKDEYEEEYINILSEIEEIIKFIQEQFPDTSIILKKGGRDFKVSASKALVEQVFTNIITNAVEYSDKNSGKVEVDFREEDNEYIFTCKDNGIGIPKEDQVNIFNRFFRASNAANAKEKGTGLGLFIVKMISNNLGWEVSFKSEAGKGTTFFVKIPIKK